MNYNYKCIVSKNGKRYYKNVRGKWKRISNAVGMKAEKGKKKYGSGGGDTGSGGERNCDCGERNCNICRERCKDLVNDYKNYILEYHPDDNEWKNVLAHENRENVKKQIRQLQDTIRQCGGDYDEAPQLPRGALGTAMNFLAGLPRP